MESSITQQIRKQLHEGKSSAEVIRLGFKASTVYKVQHQWRRGEDGPEVGSPGPEVEALGTTGSNDPHLNMTRTKPILTRSRWNSSPPPLRSKVCAFRSQI